MTTLERRLIESDDFPFEFLSALAERESWRKEIHRPIYHVHKWWAKRLGSVFRGILLGCALPPDADLRERFYQSHDLAALTVLDPFMGSGTTIGEAHKLGMGALGRDINPVAVESVRVALGPLDAARLDASFRQLEQTTGEQLAAFYRTEDAQGRAATVLYYFWVMQAACSHCAAVNDLFSTYVIAANAYPSRRPEVQVVCPVCGDIFPALGSDTSVTCRHGHEFDPHAGPAKGAQARCTTCAASFKVRSAVAAAGPRFRLYGKLVLCEGGEKQYLQVSDADLKAYAACSEQLAQYSNDLPTLALEDGYNTRQAIGFGFRTWRDFFNDRQLLALATLKRGIERLSDEESRRALLTLFSGVLEFNNMFASYKGEGTGAVRHMFAHHILKPERTPIEANIWGTPKSSGSFSSLYRGRLVRALNYRATPTELNETASAKAVIASPAFGGQLAEWRMPLRRRAIALSCGDSSATGLPDKSVDLVVTDPPFFDNVHYSELADFFHAWQTDAACPASTRHEREVQDADAQSFTRKLTDVWREVHRLLVDDGLLVFTYHHSRDEGWRAVGEAIVAAGFTVVNCQPVKAEMSVATPKAQAKEPIQLDIVLVCRKSMRPAPVHSVADALETAARKLARLRNVGLALSPADCRIVRYGQLLTCVRSVDDLRVLSPDLLSGEKLLA